MSLAFDASRNAPSSEDRLVTFSLSSDLIHDCLDPGYRLSRNFPGSNPPSSRGNTIWDHAFKNLTQRLVEVEGWSMKIVEQQHRFVHPDGIMAMTLSSAENVANSDPQQTPRTKNPKGAVTESALDDQPMAPVLPLFEDDEQPPRVEPSSESMPPLWFLLYEVTDRGLLLELSRPKKMEQSGRVVEWSDRIIIKPLLLVDDFDDFAPQEEEEIDVVVEPR